MKTVRSKSKALRSFHIVLFCSMLLASTQMAGAQSWRDMLKNTTKQFNKSLQRTNENLRRSAEQWQRTQGQQWQRQTENFRRGVEQWQRTQGQQWQRQTQNTFKNYSDYTKKTLDNQWQKSQIWWKNQGRNDVKTFTTRTRENLDKVYQTYSPTIQMEIQRNIDQFGRTAPGVVDNCSKAAVDWGEYAGTKLSEYYRKQGKEAGDRLFRDLSYYAPQARDRIVESYSLWGPEVGKAIKKAYDDYGPQIGNDLQKAYKEYGPFVGNEIKTAYETWGPRIGESIQSAYIEYGPQVGEYVHEVYLEFDQTVGEEVRKNYLPRLMESISDEQDQQMAIETVGQVVDIYRNRKKICHSALKTLAETPIETPYGKKSMSDFSREWIRENCPALVGTDIEKDPAKVVTYVLIFPDKRAIFTELKLVPGRDGNAVTCSEKLREVAGIDVDAAIETLDLMADIESIAEGNIDPVHLANTSKKIQKKIEENNERS